MSSWFWLLFAVGTILCWGAYGPVIHEGNAGLKSPWKTILCVGGAYFVIGVIIPTVILAATESEWHFPRQGLVFACIGGALGAFGAIGVVASLKTGGKPIYVMPLIFGGAPLVNVLVSSWMHPPKSAPQVGLYAGVLLLLVGAAMVLYFKPN